MTEKRESLGILAGGIAHDFNNLLAAIAGNIGLSLLAAGLDDPTRKRLIEAEKATVRAQDLTTLLLAFSKGGKHVRERASLAEVIRDSATFILGGSEVLFKFSIPDDLWLVSIDKGQIGRVIQNLVLNAGQAMPEGGVVEISCRNEEPKQRECVPFPQNQKHVKISIKDNGLGIPEKLIDRIFDPYFSTKTDGSGLGLAISHSIIQKHDGHISVQSKPGAGTIFTISLPACFGKLEKTEYEIDSDYQPVHARILVMDDDALVRDVTGQMLNHLGHIVICAKNGTETVQLYEDSANSGQPIDLVIMDLTVSDAMDGKEALKKILAIDPAAKIIVSGYYSNDPAIENFSEYGFCPAIAKPYLIQELKEAVTGVLRQKHQ